MAREQVARRDLAVALELHELLLRRAGRSRPAVLTRPFCCSGGDLLLPQAVDVHRALGDEVLEQLPLALGARAVRALGEDARALDGRCVAERAALRAAAAARRASASRRACGAGETTCGITSPARRTITSSPTRTSLRARSSSLCSVASLTVTPPTCTGSSSANGCRSPNLPTFHWTALSVVTAVVGGNFQAIAQRGSRPDHAEPPLQLDVVDLDHHAVDLEVQRAAALLPGQAALDDRLLGLEPLDVAVDAEAVLAQPLERLPVRAEADALGDADAVAPHRQRPVGGEARVELADGPRRRVARVHEGRQAALGAALVERGEVGQRHVDLAADLEQRRGVLDPQRDRGDRAQVVGDVLADLAVAARRAALEHAVAVEQRDRQPVDLRLGDEGEGRVLDPLAGEVVAHAVDPGAQLLLGAGVGEREHRLQVRDLLEPRDRLGPDPLGGRVRRDQLGMLGLERRAARRAARRRRRRRSPGRPRRSSGGCGTRARGAAPRRGRRAWWRSFHFLRGRREQPRQVVGAQVVQPVARR